MNGPTGAQRIVRRATSEPVGLSVRSGDLVWRENGGSTGRILDDRGMTY